MTRYVRFEEIDGDLMVRVPADLAAELGFVAGDAAAMSHGAAELVIARAEERIQHQLRLGRKIMKENAGVLAALAK
ncbi:hypothetical protein [Methylopila sp. M107]|uniref:hypothetical protein n=1 Tax=Methylopila sp. M107 TaxID=1101190 RepID=UPI00036769B1|nr:hypothetical protein [Methylopila sp. M107]